MENTFLLDFSNTLGGFMMGMSDSTDMFVAAAVLLGTVALMIAIVDRRQKNQL